MIKAIVFDFDGVILESSEIKTEAFKELFSDYPDKAGEITRYHVENGGISRFVKFSYIYKRILGKDLSKEEKLRLGERFSEIVLKKILAAPFVKGTREFLDRNKGKYLFFIASGTPEEELRNIVSARGLADYFKEIHGSPKEKAFIIEEIAEKYRFEKENILYIGDAESDRLAAERAGVVYVERLADFDGESKDTLKIKDLTGLEEILK